MGLDSVELVMDVEARFGIELPDWDCAKVRTVGDLAAVVAQRGRRPRGGACPTADTFYWVRRTLIASAGVARSAVRPSTRLEALIPGNRARRAAWKALRVGRPALPQLETPARVDGALLFVCVIGFFAALLVVPVTLTGSPWSLLPAGMIVLAIVAAAMNILPGPWQVLPPLGIKTVGDIARAISPLETAGMKGQDALMLQVRALVASQTGLPLEKVQPTSRFIEDLGF